MTASDVDDYLAGLSEPKRSTLEAMRETILSVIPEAEQGIAWNMPAFKVQGKWVAGFCAFKNHLSYFPHSGSVLPELAETTTVLEGYEWSKGTLRFDVDKPLPRALVETLIETRMRQALG